MISKFTKGKVYIFIDAANIFYTQRSLKWRISYEKLMQYFRKECGKQLGLVFIYTATDSNRPEQKKFLDMLDINGYIVRTKEVKKIRVAKGVYEWKGDFDIELAMDTMDYLKEFDTAILFSGDSDFAPIIKRIKEKEKKVIVLSAKNHISKELIQMSNKYINLKRLRNEIELKKSPWQKPGRDSSLSSRRITGAISNPAKRDG